MRTALAPRSATVNVVAPTTLPAPIGGWNARDALAAMPVEDAEIMDNWFPLATDVRPRPGSDTYCSGLPGQVESIIPYNGGSRLKILVASAGAIYNATTIATNGTIPSGSTIASGFSNSRFQAVNFGTAGGQFLMAVNGADDRQLYDGTNWYSATISSSVTTIGTITNIGVYNRRIFYTQSGSLSFAFHHQVNAIGGTIDTFPLAGLCKLGGELIAVDTWTRDGGDGMDDYCAFISSRGEVVVYLGTDPANASSWVLQGVYRIPEPIGKRCAVKYGADLLILTRSGLLPLSTVLSGVEPQAFVTDKIRNKLTEAVSIYGQYFGWEVKYFPGGPWLIINVPVSEGAFQQQYVMNTQTGAWCRFLALSANCWEVYDNKVYFGSNTKVIQGNIGTNDDGADIQLDVKQAASVFGAPGQLKHFKLFRPIISSDSDLALAFGVNVDFSNLPPENIPTAVPTDFAEWDIATWDDYFWSGDPVPIGSWQSAGVLGTYGQIRIKGNVNTETIRWWATDVAMEPGGIL